MKYPDDRIDPTDVITPGCLPGSVPWYDPDNITGPGPAPWS